MTMYREVLFFVLCFSSLENLSLEKVIKYNEMDGCSNKGKIIFNSPCGYRAKELVVYNSRTTSTPLTTGGKK